MPLIHSKRPSAFKKNIETEMEHGKPQKQAVAIAYKMAGEHKSEGGCIGSRCKGCSDSSCYAKGGEIKGVNKPSLSDPGTSEAGKRLKPAFSIGGPKWDTENAKDIHRKTLEEMKSMKKPNLYAKGGQVQDNMAAVQRGANTTTSSPDDSEEDPSYQGINVASAVKNAQQQTAQKYPNGIQLDSLGNRMEAKGGEIDDEDSDMEDELHSALGEEYMGAMDRKDKKGIISAIEACVTRCMNKE